jgi:pimeloyl-ACP methyl ester carboxylesterase
MGERKLFASKLILIGSAGISESKSIKVRVLGLAAKGFKFLLNLPIVNLLKDTVRRKIYTVLGSDYYASEHLKNVFQNVISEDLQVFAAEIAVPTLLIYGKDDDVTPISYGQKLNRLIGGSVLETIPGTHIIHKEDPEKVAGLIKIFLC